jgi:hypothetical protein
LKYDMTSSRTVKTLTYLVAAMTAVTLVLSLVEPWTVSLRPREAHAGQEMLPPTLSAFRTTPPQTIELVLAPRGRDGRLPDAHVIVRSDGQVETTRLWDASRPLANGVVRVCAVYEGQPSDLTLRGWLAACDDAGTRFHADPNAIRLKTLPQVNADAIQAKALGQIQRRLAVMLKNR